MAYADYTYYTTNYLGSEVKQSDFDRVVSKASDFIDAYTFNRLVDSPALVDDRVKKACCAIAEVVYSYEQQGNDGVKTSETVGEYSVSFSPATNSLGHVLTQQDKKYALLKQYLGSTGLMYRGW